MAWYETNVRAPSGVGQMPDTAPGAVLGMGISNAIGSFLDRTAKMEETKRASERQAFQMGQELLGNAMKEKQMQQAIEQAAADRAMRQEESALDRAMRQQELGANIASKNAYNQLMREQMAATAANQRLALDVEAQKAILAAQMKEEELKRKQAESLSDTRSNVMKQVAQLGNAEDVSKALLEARQAGPAVEKVVLENIMGEIYQPEPSWYELGDWGRRDIDTSKITTMLEALKTK